MKALYCTADKIGTATGGGAVTKNELQALMAVANDVTVLSYDELSPERWRQPETPFMYDYMALQMVQGKRFKLAHFYSGTFTQTVAYLRRRGVKISYTVPFHDRKVTVDEFTRNGIEYPWRHIKDDDLWEIFSGGYRLADQLIAPSSSAAALLKEATGKDVLVIPHGCELPVNWPPPQDKFRVGYLGSYGTDKGVRYLIEAWSLLNYTDAELWLAGSGSENLALYIGQIAKNGTFNLLGRVKDVAELYANISVYVQPSVCEAFGIEILEAMAYGRPVIASVGAGASELVSSECGVTVPIRNPEVIATAIASMRHKPLIEMGKKGRETAERYTWEKVRGLYVNAFNSL